jgi:hypothetical protein
MTTVPMQEVRNYWSSSKFIIGKNKVLQVALGKSEDDEPKLNSHKLASYLKGIGDWGLGIGDWAQSPIPNPQSPIPIPLCPCPSKFSSFLDKIIKNKNN